MGRAMLRCVMRRASRPWHLDQVWYRQAVGRRRLAGGWSRFPLCPRPGRHAPAADQLRTYRAMTHPRTLCCRRGARRVGVARRTVLRPKHLPIQRMQGRHYGSPVPRASSAPPAVSVRSSRPPRPRARPTTRAGRASPRPASPAARPRTSPPNAASPSEPAAAPRPAARSTAAGDSPPAPPVARRHRTDQASTARLPPR